MLGLAEERNEGSPEKQSSQHIIQKVEHKIKHKWEINKEMDNGISKSAN